MLVCNVSQLARRATIAAGIVEAASAQDAPGTGNVVFATLVDDPASVRDFVDAYSGLIMSEAATAVSTQDGVRIYTATVAEAGAAADAPNATAAATAPANTVLPLISGTATVGQTLSTTTGTWTGSPTITYTYQWKRGGSNISGATSSTYLLVTADLAATITVTVTATNGAGSSSATSTGVGPIASAGDPYWTSVKLLMGFNGANNATSGPGFNDESSAAHGAASRSSGVISTVQSVFGGSSLSLTGIGTISYSDHADWTLSNQPFTIEFRMRPNAVATSFLIGQWGAVLGWIIYQNNSTIALHVSTNGTTNFAPLDGGTLAANTWYAICIEFDGTKYRAYINGAMVASSTTVYNIFDTTNALAIGGPSTGSSFLYNGYLDELRFTKGVARYASDSGYTVATAEFPRS